MKFVQIAIILGLFACLNADSNAPSRPDRASREGRRGPNSRAEVQNMHQQMVRVISDQEISTALDNLAKDAYSVQKLSALRYVLMRGRRSSVSEQTQGKLNSLLEEACKNYNKSDHREVMVLKGVLNMAQQGSFLNELGKESVKKMFDEIVDNSGEHEHKAMTAQSINEIKAKDNYYAKVNYLYQMLKRPRFAGKIDKNVQSEVSSAIHDLYAQRPMDNVGLLSLLRSVLSVAQSTPFLSTINQYEVREIMLPRVESNYQKAFILARNLEKDQQQSQARLADVKTESDVKSI